VPLGDLGASFQIETPAVTAFVQGTTLRVAVATNGTTVVGNLPEGTGGLVRVQGRDPGATLITLAPGQETLVRAGQPPTPPGPLSTSTGASSEVQPDSAAPAPSRQQQRQQQQVVAQQQMLQAQAALVAGQAELARLEQQETLLRRQLAQLLAATPTPTGTGLRQTLTSLPLQPAPALTLTSSPTLAARTATAVPTAPPLTPTASPVSGETATPTPTVTALPTGTTVPTTSPTPTTVPTATASPTPTGTPLPSAACVPSGALCQAMISPPAGPMAGGIIAIGPCPTPTALNCLQFLSTGGGVTVQGIIMGAGGSPMMVDLPMVDETGTPQGSRTIVCVPLPAGQADCAAVLAGVFPAVGGSVTVSR
jgi:hypothetical protein